MHTEKPENRLSDQAFDCLLDRYRPLFAHKSAVRVPTLRQNAETRSMTILQGKRGTIFPWSEDGQVLGLDYTGNPENPALSSRKITNLEVALRPYMLTFHRLDGEYQATFPIEHLEAVADIIRVRRRRTAVGIAARNRENRLRDGSVEAFAEKPTPTMDEPVDAL